MKEKLAAFLIYLQDRFMAGVFSIKIGGYRFTRAHTASTKNSFGLVAFVDKDSGKISIGRSVKLKDYLASINDEEVKAGKFGKGPQAMTNYRVYYLELATKEEVQNVAYELNKLIK